MRPDLVRGLVMMCSPPSARGEHIITRYEDRGGVRRRTPVPDRGVRLSPTTPH